jgi:hypothetical protein
MNNMNGYSINKNEKEMELEIFKKECDSVLLIEEYSHYEQQY